jgi:branched-chain amino acid transport system permease protein
LVVFALLAIGLWLFFRYTSTGLLMRAMAERPDVAILLGVRQVRLTAVAWALGAVVSLIVGVMAAPTALLNTEMMDLYLLYSFTGVIIGGMRSFPGCVVGGICVGIVNNVAAAVFDPQVGIEMVFVLLAITLVIRPHGIFGSEVAERL